MQSSIVNVTYTNTECIFVLSMNVFMLDLFHAFVMESIQDSIIYGLKYFNKCFYRFSIFLELNLNFR
jgi:hypothetical protein